MARVAWAGQRRIIYEKIVITQVKFARRLERSTCKHRSRLTAEIKAFRPIATLFQPELEARAVPQRDMQLTPLKKLVS